MATYHALVVLASACMLIFLGTTTEATSTTHPYASFIHLASVGGWFGISFWVTFVAGVLLFKYLPRHQFGSVQGKIFPYYFALSLVLTSLALASWVHLEGGLDLLAAIKSGNEDGKVVACLGGAALLSALQLLVLGPCVTQAMEARNKKEKVGAFSDIVGNCTISLFTHLLLTYFIPPPSFRRKASQTPQARWAGALSCYSWGRRSRACMAFHLLRIS